MPAIVSSAPGKVILCGEHAAVYGRPAIALPVFNVSTTCRITAQPLPSADGVLVSAKPVAFESSLNQMRPGHPIKRAIELVLAQLEIDHLPNCRIDITSTLPISSGLGSSASLAVAVIRAVSSFLGHPFPDDIVSGLAFEVEKIYHGSPSGIDNSVIAYKLPIYFIKGSPIEPLQLAKPLTLVIADTGIKSSTGRVISELRSKWENAKPEYEEKFDQIREISNSIKECLESGDLVRLGAHMLENHEILRSMGVSCKNLDDLVEIAFQNSAFGAKMSGGGQGGNMIALCSPESCDTVSSALLKTGAVNTIVTTIPASLEVTHG
jgi:mevalonate kinase